MEKPCSITIYTWTGSNYEPHSPAEMSFGRLNELLDSVVQLVEHTAFYGIIGLGADEYGDIVPLIALKDAANEKTIEDFEITQSAYDSILANLQDRVAVRCPLCHHILDDDDVEMED